MASRPMPPPNRLTIDHLNKDHGIPGNAQVLTSDHHQKSHSSHRSSVSCQANESRPNIEATTSSTKHISLEGHDEPEGYIFDVFAESDDEEGNDTQSANRRKEPAVSCSNSTRNSEISELHDNQRDHTQSSRLGPMVAVIQQSNLKGTIPPTHHSRKGSTKCRASKISASSIKLAACSNTLSTKLEPSDAGKPYSGKPITNPNKLWKFRRILGHRVVGGKTEYQVDWRPTWEPESVELKEQFEKDRQATRVQKRSKPATRQPDVGGEAGPRKRRRRNQK